MTQAAATPTRRMRRASIQRGSRCRFRTTNIVLAENISKEPPGPSVRRDDNQWFEIVQWTHYALLTAEELGVPQANVDEMPNPEPQHPAFARRRARLRQEHGPDQ